MERYLGVETARGQLGRLAEEVAAGGEPVVLAKRGRALAVLVSRDEYARLKLAATRLIRAELGDRLTAIRESVAEAGLSEDAVDEAIRSVRGLG